MSVVGVCGGPERRFVCTLCGRPPGERCPKAPVEDTEKYPPDMPLYPPPRCPGCDGAGTWPRESENDCPICKGTGQWS